MMSCLTIIRESLDKLVQKNVVYFTNVTNQQFRMNTVLIHISRTIVRIFCNLVINGGIEDQLIVEFYPGITSFNTINQRFHRHIFIASFCTFRCSDLKDKWLSSENHCCLCSCFYNLITGHCISCNRNCLSRFQHEHIAKQLQTSIENFIF